MIERRTSAMEVTYSCPKCGLDVTLTAEGGPPPRAIPCPRCQRATEQPTPDRWEITCDACGEAMDKSDDARHDCTADQPLHDGCDGVDCRIPAAHQPLSECDCGGSPDPEFGLFVCSLPEHCEHPSITGDRCDTCDTEQPLPPTDQETSDA